MGDFTIAIIFLAFGVILSAVSFVLSLVCPQKQIPVITFLIGVATAAFSYFSLTIPEPEVYPSNGQMAEDGMVRITAESRLRIYYTLDASLDPKEDGIEYEGPFKPEQSMTINVKTRFLNKWSGCVTLDLVVSEEKGTVNGIETQEPGTTIEHITADWTGGKLFPGMMLDSDCIRVEGKTINGDIVKLTDFDISPECVAEGTNIITVISDGLEAEFEVIVEQPQLIALRASCLAEEIHEGDLFSAEMFEVFGIYEDGSEQKLEDFTITPDTASELGSSTIKLEKEGLETEITVNVSEKEYAFTYISEFHTPNSNSGPEVRLTNWVENEDFSTDGKTFSGLKLRFEFLLSSLFGNGTTPSDDMESRIYLAVNQDVIRKRQEEERVFRGYIVVGRESNSSVTTAEVSIYADDELVYESGEITSASINIPGYCIPVDGVSQIIIQTNAHVCGNPFYLGFAIE